VLYAQRHGYTWTYWKGKRARRRPLWNIASQEGDERSRAEHGSYNTAIQGSASDYSIRASVEIVQWIKAEHLAPHVMLVLSVHDSQVLDVREDLVPMVVSEVKAIMTRYPIPNGVPLEVDVEVGPSWGSLEKWGEH
jgi:DNA polymerase I-like protein with 3'-5' exonuclease and polymerase domains